MKTPLRTLLVEDSPDDAELVLHALRRAGYDPQVERVETRQAMAAALAGGPWDIILCDYSMPHFSAPAALETLKEAALDVPFIIVSGAIGENTAVELMRAGAHDYVMKDHLARLAPAVGRELAEAEQRRKRREAEEEIENLAKFPSENPDPVLRISADGRVLYANAASEGLLAAWSSGVGQRAPDVWRDRVSWSLDGGGLWREALTHEGRIFSFSGVPVPAAGYVNLYGRDVTDRRRAEDELRLLSSRQEAILASVPDIIMGVDDRKVYTWANQAGLAFFGPEVLGTEANYYFEGQQDTYDVVQPLFDGSEETIYVESWQRRRDGAKRLLAWWCRGLKDPRGHVTGTLSTARDITERKRAEEALRDSEERYRQVVSSATDAVMVFDAETRKFLDVNEACTTLYGYSRDEFIEMKQDDITIEPAESDATIRQTIADQLHRIPLRYHKKKDGTVFPVEITGSTFTYRGRQVACGVVRDITDRKHAEEVADAARRQTEQVLRSSPAVIYGCRIDPGCGPEDPHQAVFVSPNIERIFGCKPDQCLSDATWWPEHIHPDDAAKAFANMRRLFDEGRLTHEYRIRHRDGSYRWVRDDVVLKTDDTGKPTEFVGSWTDISQRRQAQERLRAFSKVFLDVTVPTIIEDLDGNVTDVNDEAIASYGWSLEELIGRPIKVLVPADRHARADELRARCKAGQAVRNVEEVRRRKDGTPVPVLLAMSLLTDERDRPVGVATVAQDMTEHKKLEEQLRQSQKMEAIGLLAGGIAHDFRNQLTVIRGYGERLLRRSLVSEEGLKAVGEILKAAERSVTLTGQLLAFSRREMLRPMVVDLRELISDTAKALSQMIGEDIRLSITSGHSACRANVDVNQLQQAVLNLVVNARHAMPAGGELVIETSCIEADASFRQRHPGTAPGPYVVLSVTDTGRGMDAETLERVFEPFFTTKEVGQGTGMGLAMVYGFIKQSDGAIEADSEPGKGSTFRLYFPRVEAPAVPIGHIEIPHEIPRGMETILLVEDEEPVRQMLAELLRESGYTVIEASNAAEALPLGEHYEGQIDALVTDIIMPGMSGVQLAQRVRQARPGIAILYITAYGGADLAQRGIVGIDDSDLLVKPFTSAEVVRRIRQALASAPRPAAQ